jgi:hypothetical protein
MKDKDDGKKKEPDPRYWNDMLSQNGVFSTTECTGMIPAPPLNDEQVDGYLDLFHVPQQKASVARKAENPEEQKKRDMDS